MPYGLPSKLNTPANNSFMERCVLRVKQQTNKRTGEKFTKQDAIRVCKASLINRKGDAAAAARLIEAYLAGIAAIKDLEE